MATSPGHSLRRCVTMGPPTAWGPWAADCRREESMGRGTQHYMTRDERFLLEGMYMAGAGVTEIARKLGFCRQTIYNEIKRGLYMHRCDYWDEVRYSADKAQQIHEYNQTAKGRPLKIGNDHALADYLEKKMLGIQPNGKQDRRKRFSPSAALAAARAEGFTTSVCPSTLYSYIDKRVFLHITNKDLIEKGRTRQKAAKPERRTVHPALPSIVNRPEAANRREELGHKEIDLVVGCANTKAATLTITDRKGREEMAFLLPDKRAASVRAVFDRLERKLGKRKFRKTFRSITTDNGPEFLEYDLLTQSIYGGKRFEVYYCHSYSAWEKGTNENHNRLLRRFFPKGTDFTKVSQRQIQEAVDWMNNYPRKVLGWLTPAEAGRL